MTATPIKCFFLEPTDRIRYSLRRYGGECPKSGLSYHNAETPFGDFSKDHQPAKPDHFYPGWPKACSCGYVFKEEDTWQLFNNYIYRRSDTGAEMTLHEAQNIPGAMWDATWLEGHFGTGPDGRCLIVVLPCLHQWTVDGCSSNCTMPEDRLQKNHHCWTRTGNVPDITVGKEYGPTCAAGGGSIQSTNWHGFLTRGWLHTDRNVPL